MTNQSSLTEVERIVANTNIHISLSAKGINIVAKTPRLTLAPAAPDDVDFYQSLWADPNVMKLFGDGQPRLHKDKASQEAGKIDYAQHRLVDMDNSWCKRWLAGNPFSGMTVSLNDTQEKLGSIVIGGGELAGFGSQNFWGKGYASEAAIALTKAVLPAIVLSGCADITPKWIEGTARADNPGSWKVMEKIGMKLDPSVTEAQFGDKKYARLKYQIDVKSLVDDFQRIKTSKQGSFLPFYTLTQQSSEPAENQNIVHKGGHNLRQTQARKSRMM